MMRCPRREFLKKTVGAAAALFAARGRAAANLFGKPKVPPNLVIVFPDQMRGQAMGFLGEEPVITPRLDRFAEESLVFTQAVSNYPVCSPFRAMLMTGRFPHKNGVLSNCNSKTTPFDNELRREDRCWSDVLKDQGYSLGYIGKWHLDAPRKPFVISGNNSSRFAWNEWCSPDRRHGFDFWYAYGTYDNHLAPEYWTTDGPRDRRVKIDRWSPEHEADQAIRYIRNEGGAYRVEGRPFALVVSMNPPHMPYHLVPKKYVDRYAGKTAEDLVVRGSVDLSKDTKGSRLARKQQKNYFAMITGVDEQFGRILDALEAEDLARDTIVLFTSDHGNCLGCHDEVSKNNRYEESMRVPFLLRWPGNIASRRDDLLLSSPDIAPTLLDLLGLKPHIPECMDGKSHAGICLTGEGKRPTSQFYLWVPVGEPAWGRRGVRTRTHTLEITKEKGKPPTTILHDNVKDPYQLENIAEVRPDLVKRLVETELIPWLEAAEDPWLSV